MTLEFMPPVGTVPFGVRWPVGGSMAKVEMLLEDELATNAKRVAGAGAGGLFTAPQPVKIMGTMKIKMERAIFLTDMLVLLVEISGAGTMPNPQETRPTGRNPRDRVLSPRIVGLRAMDSEGAKEAVKFL
jgi:hypothetical protein